MSRRPDTLDLLAAARPARLDPPLADTASAVAAIVAHSAPAPRRRRRLAAILVPAGLTAAVAVTAVALAVGTPATPPTPNPAPPALSAGQILLAAADRSGTATTGPGRYLVVREEYGAVLQIDGGGDTYAMLQKTASETWLSRSGRDPNWVASQSLGLTPVTQADEAAWRGHGSPTEVMVIKPIPKGRGPGSPVRIEPGARQANEFKGAAVYGIGTDNVTVADLEKLPTDPAALRAELLRHYDGGGGDMPTDRDEWLFTVGGSLVAGLPVDRAVRVAAYRLLADLPGVRALGTVRDQHGRAGQAVAFIRGGAATTGQVEERLIIDPQTGTALGQEIRLVEPAGTTKWLAPGSLVSYHVILGIETTNDSPPR